jgi:hypothetical protein
MNEAPWNKEKDKIGQLPINRTNLKAHRVHLIIGSSSAFVNAWTISVLPGKFSWSFDGSSMMIFSMSSESGSKFV